MRVVEEQQEHGVMDLVPCRDWQTKMLFSHIHVELAILKEGAILVRPSFLQLVSSVRPTAVVASWVAPSVVLGLLTWVFDGHADGHGRILWSAIDAECFKVNGHWFGLFH